MADRRVELVVTFELDADPELEDPDDVWDDLYACYPKDTRRSMVISIEMI